MRRSAMLWYRSYRRIAFQAVLSPLAAVHSTPVRWAMSKLPRCCRSVDPHVVRRRGPLGPRHWPVASLPERGGIEIGHEAATLVMHAAVRQPTSWRTAQFIEQAHTLLLGLRLDPGQSRPCRLNLECGPQR
jgi:hypothetical protein